jgi:signal transduction histidine kinase
MSERPNAIFAALLGVAALASGLMVIAPLRLAHADVGGVATLVAGMVTACLAVIAESRRLPAGVVASAMLLLATLSVLGWTLAKTWLGRRRLVRLLAHGRATAGVEGVPVVVLPARRVSAFCAGGWHPRVVVTRGLLDELQPQERTAVLVHEACHARMRAPLKAQLARVCARTLFWVPVLRDLEQMYLLAAELAADAEAVARTSRAALAAALLHVVEPPLTGVTGFADAAEARIDHLLGHASDPPGPTASRLALSTLALGALVALVVVGTPIDASEAGRLHQLAGNAFQPSRLLERAFAGGVALMVVCAGIRRRAR